MGLSLLIVLVVTFLIFMYTAEGVSDKAKTVSMVIGVIFVIFLIYKVVKG